MIDRSLNYGRPVIERFLHRIAPVRRALDVGAGRGFDLETVRHVHPNASLYGLENFAPSVAELRTKGVVVSPTDIEKEPFPFPPASFDLVVANQILEHTKELFWIFDQVGRVLEDGGHLVVGVPNIAALHNRVLLLLGRQPSSLKNRSAHIRGFTRPDLLQFVDAAFPGGFALRDFGGSGFYPFSAGLARPLAAALPTFAWGIFFLFQKTRGYAGEFLDYPVRMELETRFHLG